MHHEHVSPTEAWLQAAISDGSWRGPIEASARYLDARASLLAWSTESGGADIEASPASPPDFIRFCRDMVLKGGEDVLDLHDPVLGWITWTSVQRSDNRRIALFFLSDMKISHQSVRAMAVAAAKAVVTKADLDAMRIKSSLMTQACDQLCVGLMIIDANMKILAHNESWRTILARHDGLGALSGKLVCRDRTDQNAFRAAVANVLASRSSEATVKARRLRGEEPYVLRVSTAPAQGNALNHCSLMVVDPDSNPVPNGDIWRAMFDLTECELIIAEALLSGSRINEVAARRGVSRETVRTQTKRMFARLGVSSQVDAAVRLSQTTPFRPIPVRNGA